MGEQAAKPAPDRFEIIRAVARGWWVPVVRGVAAIVFGILALLFPGAALFTLILFLAAWMAVDGVGTLWLAMTGPQERRGFWFWVEGVASLLGAALLLVLPGVSALVLVLLVAGWFAIGGAMRIMLAFRTSDVLMGLSGAVGILAGAWMIASPGGGLLALAWLLALEAFLAGALLIGVGWRLRKIHNDPHGPHPA
jgi:uncharacterized membrane protein HdeD (DUF308 family)